MRAWLLLRSLRALTLIMLLAVSASCALAEDAPFTTLCAVLRDPATFSGKVVRFRAIVEIGMEAFVVADPNEKCSTAWLQYAQKQDTPEADNLNTSLQKAHPVFRLEDGNWKQFQEALNAQFYPRDEHVVYLGGLERYTVTAMMTGRVDWGGDKGWGFGHMNGWKVQFTLVSVSDVAATENPFDEKAFSREPVRFVHGTISGRLIGADGKPIEMAWVGAIPAQGKTPLFSQEKLTEADGSYSFDVKPGTYVIVVNLNWPATESVPVLTTYYPSTESKEGATPLKVDDYTELKNIDIKLTRILVPKYYDVQALGPDGKPTKVFTMLWQSNQPEGIGNTYTDDQGHVRLLAFEGLDYLLFTQLGSNSYEQCAPVMKLNRDRSTVEPVIVKISMTQPECDKQEQAARDAIYALHDYQAP